MIRIRNWEKWQSYRSDRGQPPWIKIHREVMRNPDWVALTDAQKGQLVSLWILGADRGGIIPSDPILLQRLCYLESPPDLQLFTQLGFLEGDVKVASEWRQGDANPAPNGSQRDTLARSREAEAEAEKKQTTALSASADVASRFEEVWKIHGRGSKKKAQEQYRKAVPKLTTHDHLVDRLRAYRKAYIRPDFDGQHLERWIRDARWEESLNGNGNGPGPPSDPLDIVATEKNRKRWYEIRAELEGGGMDGDTAAEEGLEILRRELATK